VSKRGVGREACRNGHPFPEYRYVSPRGNTRCRECARLRKASQRVRKEVRPRTHCGRGHPYAGRNVMHLANGTRICRACRNIWERNRAWKERQSRPLQPPTAQFGDRNAATMNAAKTHCPRGHAYTPENIYYGTRGWRTCRTCALERRQVIRDAKRAYAARMARSGVVSGSEDQAGSARGGSTDSQ
jgi:hypothetical protein